MDNFAGPAKFRLCDKGWHPTAAAHAQRATDYLHGLPQADRTTPAHYRPFAPLRYNPTRPPPRAPPPESSGAGCEEEIMSRSRDKAKLAKLIEIEGYDSIEALMKAVFSDAVSPAICMNEDCDFTCEMEPDQDAGYCEECHTNTMKAAPVLAGLI
jgi:hypothetical protein